MPGGVGGARASLASTRFDAAAGGTSASRPCRAAWEPSDHNRRGRKRRSEPSGYGSRIDHTSGHIREQRRVDHVIARIYEHHFRRGD